MKRLIVVLMLTIACASPRPMPPQDDHSIELWLHQLWVNERSGAPFEVWLHEKTQQLERIQFNRAHKESRR